MHIPKHFWEERPEVLQALIQQFPLATLVSGGASGLTANHLPLLYDPTAGPHGVLHGHLARGNSQWKDLHGAEAMAIFSGPQAYISPSWYPSKQDEGKVVPTWNYAAVHVWGTVEVFDEPERLLAFLTRLTERHEAMRAEPWAVSDAPPDYISGLIRGIVGIGIRINRMEGKWKMSQNQPRRNRDGVIAGLQAEAGPEGAEVAKLIPPETTL